MNYTSQIEIALPVEQVIALFDKQDNLYKWMEGLQSIDEISGTPGQVGAKSRMKFKIGKREIEMIETVTVRNFPEEFTTTYEAKGVFNRVKSKFKAIDGDRAIYITEHEFQFKGMMKIIGMLMPGAFKKQSMKYLTDFKHFAEGYQE
jgi:uncharacterized membrane protein